MRNLKIDTPLVSVLTTAYNREKYIAEAIESVLASTYINFELIVVDDCSSDRTLEIAREYVAKDERVKIYVNEKNLGDYPNRNKAASYAKGKFIKYLDSDDIIYPHGLEVMVRSMEQFPEAGLGLSSTKVRTLKDIRCLTSREAYKEHFFGSGIFNRAPGSAIIQREAFQKMNGFSGLNQVGDFEFWLKMAVNYPVVAFPPDLYLSRDHDERQLKMNTDGEKKEMKFRVLENVFKTPALPLTEQEKKQIIDQYTQNQNLLKKIFKLFLN